MEGAVLEMLQLCSILHAIEKEHLDIVTLITEHFIENGQEIQINAPDFYGFTPFHKACDGNNVKIVEYLLQHHSIIDLYARDDCGNLPFHYACRIGNMKIIKLFFNFAINHNQIDWLNIPNGLGQRPFHIACVHCSESILLHRC